MTKRDADAGSGTGDRWAEGGAYERYMGRWSRLVAREFLAWLRPDPAGHWLEVGCGTGALTGTVLESAAPASVTACDPSSAFIEHAIAGTRGIGAVSRADFAVAGVDELPARDGGYDAVVSGLVLNFLPEPDRAVAAMIARLRPGGLVAGYVWDYAEGMEFLRIFWDEAVAADPGAAAFDEGARFPLCRPQGMGSLFRAAGLDRVENAALEVETAFRDFEDYWQPFLGGTGPAPAYVSSLDEEKREALRLRLQKRIRPSGDGLIRLRARVWAARGYRSSTSFRDSSNPWPFRR